MSISKLSLGILLEMAIFGGLLFLPAQTLDWWRAWGFLGVVFVGAVAGTVSLSRTNPAVLKERFKPPIQKGQPLVDKIIVLLRRPYKEPSSRGAALCRYNSRYFDDAHALHGKRIDKVLIEIRRNPPRTARSCERMIETSVVMFFLFPCFPLNFPGEALLGGQAGT